MRTSTGALSSRARRSAAVLAAEPECVHADLLEGGDGPLVLPPNSRLTARPSASPGTFSSALGLTFSGAPASNLNGARLRGGRLDLHAQRTARRTLNEERPNARDSRERMG